MEKKAEGKRDRRRFRCPSSFDVLVDGSIDGGTSAIGASPGGRRGRHAAKETDNRRSEEKREEGEEGTCAPEHLKRAVIRGKDTFPSVDRARTLLDERCRWPR